MKRVFLAALAAIVAATRLEGQQSLEAAKGSMSIVSTPTSSLTVDVAETSLSFLQVHNGVFGEFAANIKYSVAAQKYKREFLGKGQWSPSLTIEPKVLLGGAPNQHGGALNFVVSGKVDLTDNKYADTSRAAGILAYHLGHQGAPTLSAGVGVFGFTGGSDVLNTTIGLSWNHQWGWHSPGLRTTESVCVDKAVGVDSAANPAHVAKCEDRFVGALARFYQADQARFDVVAFHLPLPGGSPDSVATVGVIGSTSLDIPAQGKTATNFAVGPALFASNYPDVVVGAILFEVTDAWNARGTIPELANRFAIRLYVGIPLK